MIEMIVLCVVCWLLGGVMFTLMWLIIGLRRDKRKEAPVPFADYDRANPINRGGRRWTPSRTRPEDRPGRTCETDDRREVWIEGCSQPYYMVTNKDMEVK